MESVHEVPVTGLGSHRIGSKQSHSEDFRFRVMLSGKSTANNVIVVNLHKDKNRKIRSGENQLPFDH